MGATMFTSVWPDGFRVRLFLAEPMRKDQLMELSFVFDLLRAAYGR
jgi:hypothetical protein